MTWEITAEELWFRYADGERDFRGIDLIQSEREIEGNPINLREFNLTEINLRGAYLRYADLTGANLTGAVLIEACLKRAIVRDANLHSANLHWSDLTEADLRGTNLDHVNATSAWFCGANIGGFSYAILANANFRDAITWKSAICRGGNLIWKTTMPDGTIEEGPQFGDGKGR